jgi:hypothetical protein
MEEGTRTNGASKQALLNLRIIWFALLLGPIGFMCVIAFRLMPGAREHLEVQPALIWVTTIMFATVIPMGFMIRWFLFKRMRPDGSLSPTIYRAGNIIFWAMCEMVAFLGLVTAMINGSFWPTILFVAAALGLQTITFPFARKLEPRSDTSTR